MIKKLSSQIAYTLVSSNVISSYDIELYSYGFELLSFSFMMHFIILLIAIVTRSILPAAIFTASYITLRSFCGGFHCKTVLKCTILSITIFLILLVIYKLDIIVIRVIFLICSISSVIPIVIFAPVESSNKLISVSYKRRLKHRSILLANVIVCIATISFIFNIKLLFYPLSYSLTITSFFMLI